MIELPEVTKLLSLALLQLDPRIVDKRSALNALLVEVALYLESDPLTVQQINEKVSHITGQSTYFNESDLQRAIQDCNSITTIVVRNGLVELTQTRRQSLSDVYKNADDCKIIVQRQMIDKIELEIGQPLNSEISKKLPILFFRAITEAVYHFSLELARETISIENMLYQIETSKPLEEIERFIDTSIPEDRPLLKSQIRSGIIQYLRNITPECKRLLVILLYNVLLNQILNLDPAIIQCQRGLFTHRRLYLDTNVVLSLLCRCHPQHKVVQEIISATIGLGAQLFISPITLEELNWQVKRAKKDYLVSRGSPLLARIASFSDDAILASYFDVVHRQPSLSWEAFIGPFNSLEELLLNEQILLENEKFDEAPKNPLNSEIEKSIRESKSPFVSDDVVEHDTLNCSLINILREKYPPDERGNIVWLLTIDRSLQHSQRILIGSKKLSSPYCMQISDWGEIVLPILSIATFEFDDFIGYLAQARLGALVDPSIIQFDFLETIHDARLDVDRLLQLDPNIVRQTIITLQVDDEAKSILKNASETTDGKLLHQYQLKLEPILQKAIDKNDPERIEQDVITKKLDILTQKLDIREKEITSLEEKLCKIEHSWIYRLLKMLHIHID
jgi:predicted nucleic acid-binding protein